MPITYRIDARQSLVVTTISGHIHEAELRAHAAAASADPMVQACTRAIVDISQWVEVAVDSWRWRAAKLRGCRAGRWP
jgi:hypothetical protein